MTLDEWIAQKLEGLPDTLPPDRAARLARLLGLGGESA